MNVSLLVKLGPGFFHVSPLCSIQRLKMRFLLKANELLLWAHFQLLTLALYCPPSNCCSFKSAFQLVCVLPLLPNI